MSTCLLESLSCFSMYRDWIPERLLYVFPGHILLTKLLFLCTFYMQFVLLHACMSEAVQEHGHRGCSSPGPALTMTVFLCVYAHDLTWLRCFPLSSTHLLNSTCFKALLRSCLWHQAFLHGTIPWDLQVCGSCCSVYSVCRRLPPLFSAHKLEGASSQVRILFPTLLLRYTE